MMMMMIIIIVRSSGSSSSSSSSSSMINSMISNSMIHLTMNDNALTQRMRTRGYGPVRGGVPRKRKRNNIQSRSGRERRVRRGAHISCYVLCY